ncbi:prepilin-type processing-associated H-X9-DG protein [Spirosoma oryzae]|uniref:Prepilin-type processing-associated H-X9-DG protein n=1 Tax=Spirosoma oryzae TaxID=1469603 RepID=A0A2T0SYN5_9BACT|nr:hypothetical protein [Spirosoma oryzae]PRY38473.1 prepilin-type processing-associated H-X9-DG protein [Spirosoma oryzae]
MKTLFFATQGLATDNAFSTRDGYPVRSLRVFTSEQALLDNQEKIWNDSDHRSNLIPCSHQTVASNYGEGLVFADGHVESISDYLDWIHGEGDEPYDARLPKPEFVLRFNEFAYYTQPVDLVKLAKTEIWVGNQY